MKAIFPVSAMGEGSERRSRGNRLPKRKTHSSRIARILSYYKTRSIIKDIKQGFKEVELIREGKIKPKSLEDLLNEL